MAKLAIILHHGGLGLKESRLSRILDFFGVPWKAVNVRGPARTGQDSLEYVVFGSAQAVATSLRQEGVVDHPNSKPAAYYAFSDDDWTTSSRALQFLLRDERLSLQDAPARNLSLCVSGKLADVTGPMSGLSVSSRLRREDAILVVAPTDGESMFAPVISAGNYPVFFRFQQKGIPIFWCNSSEIVDIDQPVKKGFYDVKEHFCSVVPLVMFIKFMFPDVAWRPQELGACLIIDDPLLRPQYGFCNFVNLRDLMLRHGFTTNIAFIPWNWRRTSSTASEFFKKDSGLFSVSIHGCDHTANEFGTASPEVLAAAARLAQSRMQNHKARTGIEHDPIMIFPQGVFSSITPEVLKQNGYLAAVNTEIVPVDSQHCQTRIRDVWDVAVMSYGDFPIFTRRYVSHGLENFAFDLLLGKPCLIVAHHDVLKDGGARLVELIGEIGSLESCLHWRPLGETIRRACRRRTDGLGMEEVEMYGNELMLDNPSDQTVEVKIRKRKSQDDLVLEILSDEIPIMCASEADHLVFGDRIGPRREKRFRVVYYGQSVSDNMRRSLRFELSVAARRLLCEFRDNYLLTNRFLSVSTYKLKTVLRRAL